MRIIKLGLISAVVFFFLITGFSLFIPSHVRISKAIDINTSKDSVKSQLDNVANWKKWYPGIDSVKEIPVITAVTDSTVVVEQKKAVAGWNILDAGIPNTVTVQWYMDFHLSWFPWEKFSSLLLEKRYGPMMEKGLENLKTLLEK